MELAYFVSVIFIASTLQGITGFGSALIASPLLFLLFDKGTSVVSLSFMSIALNSFLLLAIKYPVDKKTFYNLFFPAVLGLPVGILILNRFDLVALKILVASLSMLFAVLLFSKSLKIKSTKWKRVVAGWFYGILQTSTGVSAPPVVLVLASENTEKDEMRKTLALFFLATSIVSVFFFFFTKHFTSEVARFSLWGIPTAVLGGWIGNIISKRVSQKDFIWSVFILIAVTLIVAVYSGIKDYLG